jgi:hypothetical protein
MHTHNITGVNSETAGVKTGRLKPKYKQELIKTAQFQGRK